MAFSWPVVPSIAKNSISRDTACSASKSIFVARIVPPVSRLDSLRHALLKKNHSGRTAHGGVAHPNCLFSHPTALAWLGVVDVCRRPRPKWCDRMQSKSGATSGASQSFWLWVLCLVGLDYFS